MLILVQLVELLYTVFVIMLFVRILSSWIPELRDSRILQFISFYTDPYLNFFRKFIPPLGMIDISPIIAFLCLSLIKYILIRIIVFIFLM